MPPAALLAVTLAAASLSVVTADVNSTLETAEDQTIESHDQIHNVSVDFDAYDEHLNEVSEEEEGNVEYQIYEIEDPG